MPASKHTKILKDNKKNAYQSAQYMKFLQFAFNPEGPGKEFAKEVDTLQQYDKQIRDDFLEAQKRVTTHPNHTKAFGQLEQSLQEQLDYVNELLHHIITKAPEIDPSKRNQLHIEISREEIFLNFLKIHFEIETDYAALKDRPKSKKNNKELKKRENVIIELRKNISEFSEVVADLKKCKIRDTNKYAELSEQLDKCIASYNQQKSAYDTLVQQYIAQEKPTAAVTTEKAQEPAAAEKTEKDEKQKNSGFLDKLERRAIQTASNLQDVINAIKEVGIAVVVKPSQKMANRVIAKLPQKDEPLDPNMQISTPNGTQEYDQVLLYEKSPIDNKYKKALEDKIRELEGRNTAVIDKNEKQLVVTLLVVARAYLDKISTHNGSSNIEDIVKEEKKSFFHAIHALLFLQLKQINLQTLKNRLKDLEGEKRLIEKLPTPRDEEQRAAFIAVINECCDAIKKAREKIKKTKSYDQIKKITESLACFKDIYKSAKAEFDQYLGANTAAPTFLPPATSAAQKGALPQSAAPASNSILTSDKPLAEAEQGDDEAPLEQEVAAVTDDFDARDSDESSATSTPRSSAPLSVGSRTPSDSPSPPQSSSPRTSDELTGQQAAAELAAQNAAAEARSIAEELKAKQAEEKAHRDDELAARKARDEQARLAVQKAEEEARLRVAEELAAQKIRDEQARLLAQKTEQEARLAAAKKAKEEAHRRAAEAELAAQRARQEQNRRNKELEEKCVREEQERVAAESNKLREGEYTNKWESELFGERQPLLPAPGANDELYSTITSSAARTSQDGFEQIPTDDKSTVVLKNVGNQAELMNIAKTAIDAYIKLLDKEIKERVLPSFLYTGTKTYKLKEFKRIKDIVDPEAFFAAIETAKKNKDLVTGWISDRSRVLLDNITDGKIDKDHPEQAIFKKVEKEVNKAEKSNRSCCFF